MTDVCHVAVGRCCGFLGTAAVPPRVQIRCVPIPPVMRDVRLLVLTMVLVCLVQELCKGCDIWRRFPLAAWKTGLDFLEQVTIPIRIFEGRERRVGTAFRVTSSDARILHSLNGPPAK